ncbi:unnamed protein product [Phyllotreta striolata]|uniref:Uncharacterized protein n=1 Tax=Phyllotreta striolata TaxID=444603 RepID=A0A9N9TVG9_PHYSR|nr:unnamed protein product [Phyllotreta striolata]
MINCRQFSPPFTIRRIFSDSMRTRTRKNRHYVRAAISPVPSAVATRTRLSLRFRHSRLKMECEENQGTNSKTAQIPLLKSRNFFGFEAIFLSGCRSDLTTDNVVSHCHATPTVVRRNYGLASLNLDASRPECSKNSAGFSCCSLSRGRIQFRSISILLRAE